MVQDQCPQLKKAYGVDWVFMRQACHGLPNNTLRQVKSEVPYLLIATQSPSQDHRAAPPPLRALVPPSNTSPEKSHVL